VVEQRYRAVLAVQAGAAVSEVALRAGVSRQTVHSWLGAYRAGAWLGWILVRAGRRRVRIRPSWRLGRDPVATGSGHVRIQGAVRVGATLDAQIRVEMVTRSLAKRLLSPVGFLGVGCFFLLPFVTVSCSGPARPDGQPPGPAGNAIYSGRSLVTGSRAELTLSKELADAQKRADPTAPDPPLRQATDEYTKPIHRQPFLLVSLALAAAAVIATAWPRSWARALCGAALAGGCALFLAGGEVIALRAAADRVNTDVAPIFELPQPGIAHVAYGFWLALATLAVLTAIDVFDLVRLSTASVPVPSEPAPASLPP
jgi:hypothetical protein